MCAAFIQELPLTVSPGACPLPTDLLGGLNFQAEICPLHTSEPCIFSSEVHVLYSNFAHAMSQGRTPQTEFCLFALFFMVTKMWRSAEMTQEM